MGSLKGGSIPIFNPNKVRERPGLAELQRKCDTARPLGMFRSTETEFLLCYDSMYLMSPFEVALMLGDSLRSLC